MSEGYGLARVALVGNPSDGCYGKAIAMTAATLRARAVVFPSEQLEVRPGRVDAPIAGSLESWPEPAGCDGGHDVGRFIESLFSVLREYCRAAGIEVPSGHFRVEYESSIPSRVGLGETSAILTATLRAVLAHCGIRLPRTTQGHLVWEAERRERGMAVGPGAAVAQAYEGLVYMDFGRDWMERWGYGSYARLDARLAGSVYVAYRADPARAEGRAGIPLAERWRAGETMAEAAMSTLAGLTVAARQALLDGEREEFHELINANLDLRMRMGAVAEADAEMVRVARAAGASANLAGSGGAIAGLFDGPHMLRRLEEGMGEVGARVMRVETEVQ